MTKADTVRYGMPSADEWKGLWKSSPRDSNVTDKEYSRACDQFDEFLAILGNVGFGEGYDFYLRGDNFGDRTQYLEIVNPKILKMSLLLGLQRILTEPSLRQWRIVIPTYIESPKGIMIYPSAIVVGAPSHEVTTSELSSIVDGMIRRRKERGS